jgi:type II secretory pathway pseudopilin PulG
LIELIAVIVVLGILSAVAVPSLTSLGDTRERMAAHVLLRDLTFARQYAVATGTTTWVVFDASAETWQVLAEDPLSPGRAGASVMTDPATGAPFERTLGADEFVGVGIVSAAFDGNDEIGFDWLGRPFNAAETALAAQGVVTLTGGDVVNVVVGTGYAKHVAP